MVSLSMNRMPRYRDIHGLYDDQAGGSREGRREDDNGGGNQDGNGHRQDNVVPPHPLHLTQLR